MQIGVFISWTKIETWSVKVHRFEGQVAVITGGARGIGRGVAERLMAEGAKVAIWDLKGAEDAAKEMGADVRGYDVDVSNEASIQRVAEATDADFGRVDILVTAAGITGPTHPVQGHAYPAWRQVIDIHLGGVFLCTRAVLDGMKLLGGESWHYWLH